MENNPAPEPEKKKELKVYTFTRNLNPEEKNGKDILNQENNILNFSLNLYDKEISIIATKKILILNYLILYMKRILPQKLCKASISFFLFWKLKKYIQ